MTAERVAVVDSTAVLRSRLEDLVPVLQWRPEARNGGMGLDHRTGHLIAGGVGVEATTDELSALDEGFEPDGIGPGAGGGDAEGAIIQGQAAHRIDGGLAEDGHSQEDGIAPTVGVQLAGLKERFEQRGG